MEWHRFNQDEDDKYDPESSRWTHVMPGDVVQSRGTIAWKHHDWVRGIRSNERALILHSAPVLVLSRMEGYDGEKPSADFVTFTCLSRHGLIIVIQPVKRDD